MGCGGSKAGAASPPIRAPDADQQQQQQQQGQQGQGAKGKGKASAPSSSSSLAPPAVVVSATPSSARRVDEAPKKQGKAKKDPDALGMPPGKDHPDRGIGVAAVRGDSVIRLAG